jgi:hypothetical protein
MIEGSANVDANADVGANEADIAANNAKGTTNTTKGTDNAKVAASNPNRNKDRNDHIEPKPRKVHPAAYHRTCPFTSSAES